MKQLLIQQYKTHLIILGITEKILDDYIYASTRVVKCDKTISIFDTGEKLYNILYYLSLDYHIKLL